MMKNSAKTVVDRMFAAFRNGDVEKLVETVSEDTFWIYHGTQIIPPGTFEKKEGVRTFFTNILESTGRGASESKTFRKGIKAKMGSDIHGEKRFDH